MSFEVKGGDEGLNALVRYTYTRRLYHVGAWSPEGGSKETKIICNYLVEAGFCLSPYLFRVRKRNANILYEALITSFF